MYVFIESWGEQHQFTEETLNMTRAMQCDPISWKSRE